MKFAVKSNEEEEGEVMGELGRSTTVYSYKHDDRNKARRDPSGTVENAWTRSGSGGWLALKSDDLVARLVDVRLLSLGAVSVDFSRLN